MSARTAVRSLALAAGLCVAAAGAGAAAPSILFIGNSFTFADRSPVHYWHPEVVTDLNGQGVGGMPALFKSFTVQAGLNYDVFVETEPGVGLDWHLERRSALLGGRAWDSVVMHGYSTLDRNKPGNSALLVDAVHRMTELLRVRNPAVEIRLMATWPRADQLYEPQGAWYGKSVETMANDLRSGYERAAAATPGIKGLIPVGDSWVRAMRAGVADANPYDGIEPGKVDLWSWDHYHASSFGYYLEALVVFGSVTGVDPRLLGENECSAAELGLSPAQAVALEHVAFDQLSMSGQVKVTALKLPHPGDRGRCVRLRRTDEPATEAERVGVLRTDPVRKSLPR